MAGTLVLKPDQEFIAGVMANGGGDLKKCMQCANCTASCVLAGEETSFPRSQVLRAQMGLAQELLGDPDVWLCHHCGECTERCPRGARPGDILNAVRSQLIRRLSFPGFMGTLVADSLGIWMLFTIPLFILLALAKLPLRVPPGRPMEFADLFPKDRLEVLFFAISALSLLAFVMGAVRLLRAFRAQGIQGPILRDVPRALADIVRHGRFAQCERQQLRYWGHLFLFLGFVGLGLVGTVIGIGNLAGLVTTPLPFTSPFKLFANACAVVALIGTVFLLVNRISDRERRQRAVYFDWVFLWTLACALLAGVSAEVFRLLQNEAWMYAVYFVHLLLVFALLLYAPYSKFAHVVYRPLAMAAMWRQEHRAQQTSQSLPAAEARASG